MLVVSSGAGAGEISQLQERLTATAAHRKGTHLVIPLHSNVAPAEQRAAFQRPRPGVRKIVIATNIAETSLTIEDVVYVVDSAKLKVWMVGSPIFTVMSSSEKLEGKSGCSQQMWPLGCRGHYHGLTDQAAASSPPLYSFSAANADSHHIVLSRSVSISCLIVNLPA